MLSYYKSIFFLKKSLLSFLHINVAFNLDWPNVDKMFQNKSHKMSNAVE